MAVQLTQAILTQEPFACDMAASMGRSALPELARLIKNKDLCIRMDAIRALGKMDISISYELLFSGLDDTNINVVQASLSSIENHKAYLSTQILFGLLTKIQHSVVKGRIILMLGDVLKPAEVAPLEEYCTIEHGENIALHTITALAKIGIDNRRQQFGTYLLSIKNNPALFRLLFSFIDYIHQPWLLPVLRQLLNNKTSMQTLSANLPNRPHLVRVCDRVLLAVLSITGKNLAIKTTGLANFTDSQLAEANRLASQFQH